MFRVKDSIHIQAPVERCFLLSTSVDLVKKTLDLTAVKERTHGLVEAGDRVEWRGWKFGLPAVHGTLITQYDPPRYFQDSMEFGRFRRFFHDHFFESIDGVTLLTDVMHFSLPGGGAGRIVGRFIVAPHVQRLVKKRFALLKRVAESDEWKQYLEEA